MQGTLSRAWWVLVVRGVVGVLFGIAAFMVPGTVLQALLLLFGVYAMIDGVFALMSAFRAAEVEQRWWPFVLEGVVGLIAGVGTLFVPGLTVLALVSVAGAWALLTGIFEIAAAIRLREMIEREWVMILSGIVSIIFGIIILAFPLAAAVWFVFLFGAYALVFGILFILLGFRVRRLPV